MALGTGEGNDAFLVIGIFVFMFIVWVISGGPSKPISFGGPLLTSPQPLSSGRALGNGALLDYRVSPILRRETPRPVRHQVTRRSGGSIVVDGSRSPYIGLVRLSRTNATRNSDPKQEYIRLSVSRQAQKPIDISGWTVSSGISGTKEKILTGSNLPLSGTVSRQEDIVLNPGDFAYIISGRSPIGTSFRSNSCIGYFSQFQRFSPSLSRTCPLPEKEIRTQTSINLDRQVDCEQFVQQIPRCTLVTSIPPHLSSECRAFISKNLNYNGCVAAHQQDNNFYKNDWRIYLGRSGEMWRNDREIVQLFDERGRLVDTFSY